MVWRSNAVKPRMQAVVDLEIWRKVVSEEGSKLGLMPALLDYFDDYIAEGDSPERALDRAKQACEIVEIVDEI